MLNYDPADPGLYFALEDDTLLKVGPTHVGSSAPNSGAQGFAGYAKGEQWLDTSAGNALKTWDGTSWLAGSFALSGDSLINDGTGVRLNGNSTDFATFPRNDSGNHYNLSGNIGFGTNTPTHRVSVNGGLRLLDQVDYPAGNLGAVAVVGGAFIFHNGSTWVNILSTNNPWTVNGNDVYYDQGNVLIGGTLPASPNIELNANGSAEFTGGSLHKVVTWAPNRDSPYLIAATTSYDGTPTNPGSYGYQYRYKLDAAGADRITIDTSAGEVYTMDRFGSIKLGGTLPLSPNISLNEDGSAAFAGDVTCTDNSKGLVLKSPDGTSFRLSVANDGTLSASSI